MTQQPGLRATSDSAPAFASDPQRGGTEGGWMEAVQGSWQKALFPWAAYSLAIFLVSVGLLFTYGRIASGIVEASPSLWLLTDYRTFILVGMVVYTLVTYPFATGGVGVAFRILRGQTWTLADFLGFLPRYGSYAALGLFYAILATLLLLPYELYARLGEGGWLPDFNQMAALSLIASAAVVVTLYLAWIAALAYLHVRFVFAASFVVDRKAGPLAALVDSWKLTEGRSVSISWLCYDTGLMLLLGFVPLLLGFVFVTSLATLSHVAAYLNCSGEERRQSA